MYSRMSIVRQEEGKEGGGSEGKLRVLQGLVPTHVDKPAEALEEHMWVEGGGNLQEMKLYSAAAQLSLLLPLPSLPFLLRDFPEAHSSDIQNYNSMATKSIKETLNIF